MEDGYKRDTELFRTEAMKRDQDIDEERARGDGEVAKSRSQVEQAREFISSLRKDLLKLLKQVDKK